MDGRAQHGVPRPSVGDRDRWRASLRQEVEVAPGEARFVPAG